MTDRILDRRRRLDRFGRLRVRPGTAPRTTRPTRRSTSRHRRQVRQADDQQQLGRPDASVRTERGALLLGPGCRPRAPAGCRGRPMSIRRCSSAGGPVVRPRRTRSLVSDDQQAVIDGTAAAATVSAPAVRGLADAGQDLLLEGRRGQQRRRPVSTWEGRSGASRRAASSRSMISKPTRTAKAVGILRILDRRLGRRRQRLDRRLQPGALRRADGRPQRRAVACP